jgi:hypothetical protein
MKWRLFLLLLVATSRLCAAKTDPAAEYVSALKRVTDIMVNDVTSPVASARYYAYTTLAAYETLAAFQPGQYPSLIGSLTPSPSTRAAPGAGKGFADLFQTGLVESRCCPLALRKPAQAGH